MKSKKYAIRYDWKKCYGNESMYAYYETYETNSCIKAFIKFLKLSRKYKIIDIEFRG